MSDNRDDNRGAAAGDGGSAAERIIARFGGIRPMAAKLGVAVSTVQGWKMRGQIPPTRREQIEKAAKELELELPEDELEAATSGTGEEQTSVQDTEGSLTAETAAATGTSLETESMKEAPWRTVGNSDPAEEVPVDATTSDSEETPPVVAEKSSPLPAMAIGGLLVGAGAAIAILLSDFWMPQNEPPPAAVVEALERRMARLEEQRAETSGEGLEELQRALEQTRVRVEEVDGRLAAITEEGRVEPADMESLRTVAERLSERLEALEGQQMEPRVSSVEARLQELAGRIEQVAAAPASPDEATLGRLEGIDGRIEGAAGRIAALEAQLREAVEEVEAARVRIGEETAIALAAGQLREAFRTGQPYVAELEGLRRLSGRDENLDQVIANLEQHAESGVPTLAALQASFSEAARAAVTADRAGSSDSEWQAMFWNRVDDLVSVRATGEPEGDETEAVLARAERRLEQGDLAAAVQQLDQLQGPAAQAKIGRASCRERV